MAISTYSSFQQRHRQKMETYANHLIILIGFFLPFSESARSSATFILWILFLLRGNYMLHIKSALENNIVRAFVLFFLLHLVWVLFSDDFALSFTYFRETKYFLLSLLIITFLREEYVPRFFSAFILGMLLSELVSYGVFLHILTPPIPFGRPFTTPEDPTPFFHHMVYGYLLAFAAALLLQRFFLTDTLRTRFFYALFFLSVTANVFVNAGRTGYVLYFVAVSVVLFLRYKTYWKRILLINLVFMLGVTALAYHFSPTAKLRMDQTAHALTRIVTEGDLQSSIGARVSMVLHGWELLMQQPFTGYGTGMAIVAARDYAQEKNDTKMYDLLMSVPKHDNQFIDTLLQFGFVGLFFLLNIFYQLARPGQTDPSLRTIGLTLFFLSAAYAFEATLFGTGPVAEIFVIIATVTALRPRLETPQPEKLSALSAKGFAAYTLASAIIFALSKVT
jgi:O-antigen ligase